MIQRDKARKYGKGGEAMPCSKCSGTLHEESDTYGRYISCWNCGYLKDLSVVETFANVNLKEFGERREVPSVPSRAIQRHTSSQGDTDQGEPKPKSPARPPSRITKDPREYKKEWVHRKRQQGRGPVLPVWKEGTE